MSLHRLTPSLLHCCHLLPPLFFLPFAAITCTRMLRILTRTPHAHVALQHMYRTQPIVARTCYYGVIWVCMESVLAYGVRDQAVREEIMCACHVRMLNPMLVLHAVSLMRLGSCARAHRFPCHAHVSYLQTMWHHLYVLYHTFTSLLTHSSSRSWSLLTTLFTPASAWHILSLLYILSLVLYRITSWTGACMLTYQTCHAFITHASLVAARNDTVHTTRCRVCTHTGSMTWSMRRDVAWGILLSYEDMCKECMYTSLIITVSGDVGMYVTRGVCICHMAVGCTHHATE